MYLHMAPTNILRIGNQTLKKKLLSVQWLLSLIQFFELGISYGKNATATFKNISYLLVHELENAF